LQGRALALRKCRKNCPAKNRLESKNFWRAQRGRDRKVVNEFFLKIFSASSAVKMLTIRHAQ
jgi:hypothetical protein